MDREISKAIEFASLEQVVAKLQCFRPRKKWYRRFVSRSAVALIVREAADGPEVLMIERAEREGDPWSGQMAFPGGKSDHGDKNNFHTALRETHEEIGLDIDVHSQYLARLSDILSPVRIGRRAMVITPYVFTVEQIPALTLNEEVADIVWVPLAFLADGSNRENMQWPFKKVTLTLPCYFYQQRRIWGLSLNMLDEMLRVVSDVSFS